MRMGLVCLSLWDRRKSTHIVYSSTQRACTPPSPLDNTIVELLAVLACKAPLYVFADVAEFLCDVSQVTVYASVVDMVHLTHVRPLTA
jgi:hypothetical protein